MNDLKQRLRNAAYKRDGFDAVYLAEPAAARIEELEAEVARLNWERPTAAQMAEALARVDQIDMDVLRRVEAALSFYAEWEMEPLEEPSPEEREKFFILDCPTPKAMADRGGKARSVLADLRAMMEKINE